MVRRYGSQLQALLMGADAAVAAAILIGLSAWRFGADWALWWRQIIPQPTVILGVYAGAWVGVLLFAGLYRPRARWSVLREALDVLRATVVMALLTLSVLFLFRLPDVSRLFLLSLFPAQAFATVATRALLRLVFEWLRQRGYNTRYVLVIGAGARARAFAERLESHRSLGLRIVGFVDDDPAYGHVPAPWRYLGRLERLTDILHEEVIDEVVVCLPFTQWELIDAISGICEEEGKIVRIPMDVLERALTSGRLEELDGIPVFSIVSGPDRAAALAFKRLLDVVVSATALVFSSPAFAAIATGILVSSGRPVFFRQRRVGLHGRTFTLVKFRSMTRDAEERRAALEASNEIDGRAFKVTNDPRVTRLGRFLRRTSLDELPQLWNVLVGDMSLVGPRPPLREEVKAYDIWHRRRLSMKPGMTGLWQVRSRRERNFDRWVAADLEYIDRWSLWLDLSILVRTIPAALQGR